MPETKGGSSDGDHWKVSIENHLDDRRHTLSWDDFVAINRVLRRILPIPLHEPKKLAGGSVQAA